MKLLYTPKTADQLREIRSYISHELHNPSAARSFQKKIMGDCRPLTVFPEMG